MTRAVQAGKALANNLIEHFSDRQVTLIGFSMGTEVIRSCIERLAERKRMKLLLKVMTLGGVIDQEKVEKTLWKSSEPLTWFNFLSKNDYVGRYMYRVCTMGGDPIGSSGVKWSSGHSI